MAVAPENAIMALYCDFENVALGVRDAKYDKFDIKPVLERLLLKGSIVVKKAYCDWERYKGFKSTMHEASFELIEIPHVRQSGKNSADIRLVVDALDLCYTKSHVDTFVIISGDSDFSPLVAKLRENAKYVVGIGVKQSTSDLLIANCDEFIFYDDLVREVQRSARRDARDNQPALRRTPEEDAQRRAELEERRSKAIELAVATFDALIAERGDSGKIWASMLKEAVKRRKPDFAESYYGFRAFGNLLEEAQARGLLEIGRDEKSGTYVMRCNGALGRGEAVDESVEEVATSTLTNPGNEPSSREETGESSPRSKEPVRRKASEKSGKPSREGKGERRGGQPPAPVPPSTEQTEPAGEPTGECPPTDTAPAENTASDLDTSNASKDSPLLPPLVDDSILPVVVKPAETEPLTEEALSTDKTLKKMPARSRRPRKPKPEPEAPG
ncbi:MAG: NYN domain-containing protein [Candidatus Accumulibacter sp.]|nr:NYN domain-containing protein [Accumulibacter sp.]